MVGTSSSPSNISLERHRAGRPLRVLICASNYVAIDNVLTAVHEALRESAILPEGSGQCKRSKGILSRRERASWYPKANAQWEPT